MNNEEKDLKNVEVANETEKNTRFGRKNKQKAEGEKTQEEKTVKKVNHIGLYENRELSWLKFNERVLEEAEDTSVPLCERMTFLSIFQSNLDEFFMVRVGSLEDQKLLSQKLRENKTNMTAGEQIEAILKRVAELNERKDAIYASIMKEVGEKGVHLTDFKALAKSESKYLEEYFMKEIVPLLSVMIVGRKQPFPFLKGQEIYALAVLGTRNGKKKIGIIPCSSSVFPRLIRIPTKDDTYMLVEELILHFLPKVYKGYKVLEKSVIRVTRNADIDFNAVYDEDLDYRDKMAQIVKLRKKLAPVRLELSRDINEDMIKQVCEYAEMEEPHVFLNQAPLDLSFLFQIEDILRKDANLVYQRRVPQPSPMLKSNEHIIPQILDHDVLLSYPYESIKPFLQMLQEAARDPEVISIRMTLYRLARNSKVVEALTEAAENGKQVDVLVELKIAMIFGLPLGRIVGLYVGWRMTFFCVAVVAFLALIYMAFVFPKVEGGTSFKMKELPVILKNPVMLGIILMSFLVAGAYYTGYSYIEPFLKQVAMFKDNLVTITLMLFGAAGILGSFLFSCVYDKHRYHFIRASITLIAVVMLCLKPASKFTWTMILICMLWGMAVTAFSVTFQSETIKAVPEEASAVAMSMFSGIYNLGIGCGTWIGGLVCTHASMGYIGFAGGIMAVIAILYCSFILIPQMKRK